MGDASDTSPSPEALSIIIIGSGTAGLTTALALRRNGHNVHVVERQSGIKATDGYFRVDCNASRILTGPLLDLAADKGFMDRNAAKTIDALNHRFDTGEVIGMWKKFAVDGNLPLNVKRIELSQILHHKAVEAGVQFHFNAKVEELDEDRPAVKLSSGQWLSGDLIVAADGSRSTIRAKLFPKLDTTAKLQPYVAFQAEVPCDLVPADSPAQSLFSCPEFLFWYGPERYMVCGNQFHDGSFVLFMCDTSPRAVDLTGKGGYEGSAEDLVYLKERFSGFDIRLRALLALATNVERWQIMEVPRLESWASKSGKVLLIGDAAHAMGPHAGQGAAQCIEDSIALAEMLSSKHHEKLLALPRASSSSSSAATSAPGPDTTSTTISIPTLTALYTQFRSPRAAAVQAFGAWLGTNMTEPDGPVQEARDKRMRERMDRLHELNDDKAAYDEWQSIKPLETDEVTKELTDVEQDPDPMKRMWRVIGLFSNPRFGRWIRAYDVVGEVDRFLEREVVNRERDGKEETLADATGDGVTNGNGQ